MFNKTTQTVSNKPSVPMYELSITDSHIDNSYPTLFQKNMDAADITGKIVKVQICANESYNSVIMFSDGAFIICNMLSGHFIKIGSVYKISAWVHESRFEGDCFKIRAIHEV